MTPSADLPVRPVPKLPTATSALAAVALTLGFALLLDLSGRLRAPILVDIGPSTGRYGSGFEDSEETPPTTSRWTRANAAFDVPLNLIASPARISVRAARYLDDPTTITVAVDGRPVASFEQARGRQRVQSFDAPVPDGPLNISFESADPKLGMALDWFEIEGARWRIPWREWTVWIVPAGILLSLLIAGLSLARAVAATGVFQLLLAGFAAVDPFGFVHVLRDVAVPLITSASLTAVAFRGRPDLVLAVIATLALKGGFLFHPNYFYNDVRQNDRYVGALKSYEGSLMERSRRAQVDLGVGYPRIVAGKKYAFPYSPIFYVPFTSVPSDRDLVVRAIKQVALFTTAVEVVIAFVLARALLPAAAGSAAWLTFAFPILTSRMLYAMWSTLAGHALDLVVVLAAVSVLREPKDPRRMAGLFAATLGTFLIYVSSLFNTSAFLVALAAISAPVRRRVIAAWVVAAGLVVFGLYGDFTIAFVREIIPAIASGPGGTPAPLAPDQPSTEPAPAGLLAAFSRIPLFAGYGFPLLALAGLAVISRREDPPAVAMKAYATAFFGLVLLRGLSFGLFKDLKEIEFAGPAFAILAAVALSLIESKIARVLIATGLVIGGLVMQWGYFERWSRVVLG